MIFDLVDGPLPAPTAKPTTPANLTATAGKGAVTLAWDAVDTTSSNTNRINDVQITKHQVRQSTDGGANYGTWADIPDSAHGGLNATEHTISGLTDGTTYTFQVRAVNACTATSGCGDSDPATAVMATPDAAFPARPTGLVAVAGNTHIVLTWTDPGDASIQLYEYQQKVGSAAFGAWTEVFGSSAATTSYQRTGLINGTTYSYRLRALNRTGQYSAPSEVVTVTPQGAPPAAPVLTAIPKHRGVTLTWPDAVDPSLTGYEYQYRTGAGSYSPWQAARELTSSGTNLYFVPPHVIAFNGVHQFPVGGLTPGTAYTFRIRAVNADGMTISNEASATPTTGVPAKPTGLRIRIRTTGVTAIPFLSWDQDKDASILRYELTVDNGRTWPYSTSGVREHTTFDLPEEYRGSDHTYRIRAVNAIGPGPASEPVTEPAVPETRIWLRTVSYEWNSTTRKVTVVWGQTEHADHRWWGFRLNHRIVGRTVELRARASLPIGVTRYEIPATFNAGDEIGLWIAGCVERAGCVSGLPVVNEIRFHVGAPQVTITGFSATPGDAAITLAWDDPMDSGITHYEYEFGGNPSGQNRIPDGDDPGSDAGDETSYVVTVINNVHNIAPNTPLENGQSYSFRLRAANANGGGPWTEWIRDVVPRAAGTPAAPSGVVALRSRNFGLTTWDDPQDPSITGYQGQVNNVWQDIPGTDATTTGVNFFLSQLRAVNANGAGLGTSVRIIYSPTPARPTGFQATPGNGRVTLTWDDPGEGVYIEFWRYTTDGGETWTGIPDSRTTIEGHLTRHVVTGLTNGQAYRFAILAENGRGVGPISAAVTATPQAAAPARPTGLAAAPGNAQAALTWDDPADPSIIKYQISRNGAAWADISGSGAATVSHTVTGLVNGTAYTFRIRALNDYNSDSTDDPGAASDAVSVTPGVPTAPATLSVAPGDTQVTLTWKAPASDGGSAVTGYEYTQDAGAATPTWTDVPDGSDAGSDRADETEYTVTGLANNIAYAFAVRAENANGQGAASPVRRATPVPPGTPQRPAGFRAVPGHRQVTLRWQPPSPLHPVTAWQYRRSTDGGTTWSPDWTALPGSDADTVAHAFTGLTNGTTYTFELRALNGAVVGPAARAQAVPSPTAAEEMITGGSATGRRFTTDDGSTYTVTELSLPAGLDWRLTVSGIADIDGRAFILRSLQGTTPETARRYAFTSTGQEGLDIVVSPGLAGQTEVCLAPSDLLRSEARAAGRSLLLLRHDGTTWTALPTTTDGDLICGMTAGFSAFVPGYEDPQANEAPQPRGSVPPQPVVVGRTVTLNVAPYFTDANNDALTYTAVSSDTAKVTVSLTGSQLSLTGAATGTATVTVTATDPDGEAATQAVSVTVQANAAPVGQAIPAQNLSVGVLSRVLVDLTRYFSDANGDALTFTAPSGNANVVTTAVNNASGVLTLTAVGAGSTTVTVTATDPDSATAMQTVSVTVTANTEPTVGTLPPRTLVAGRPAATPLNLADYFADADGDPLTYTATSQNINRVTVTLTGSVLELTGVAAGPATVTVTAADPAGASVSGTVSVTVGANAAPTETSIPAQTLVLNVVRTVLVPLNSYFSDPNDDPLTYTATSGDANVVTEEVNAATGVLTLTAVAAGTTTVTVEARDPDGLTVSQTITVTVSADPAGANVAPVATQVIPLQELTVGDAAVTLDLSTYFSDPNTGDTLSYTAPSPDTDVVTTAVSNGQLTLTAVGIGTVSIQVTATESHSDGGTALLSVAVTVRLPVVNRAPVQVAEIPPQKLVLNVVNTALVPLKAYFRDPDNDSLTYTPASDDDTVVTASVAPATGVLTLTAVAAGNTTVAVTATDPDGEEARLSVTVTVTRAPSGGGGGGGQPPGGGTNAAPTVVQSIPAPPPVAAGGTSEPLDLAPYFTDPDGDSLTYAASSNDVNIVITNLARRSSRLTLHGVAPGEATVTVTASDSQGGTVTETLTVTVTASAQAQSGTAPEMAQRIPPQTVAVGEVAEPLDLAPYFRHPDGEPLTYVAVSYDADVVEAEVAAGGSELTLRGVAVGDAGVIVTARDPDGGHASQPVTVAVRTAAELRAGQPLPPQAVAAGTTSAPLDLAPHFDADGGPLTYAAVSDNPAVLVAEVVEGGSRLTLRGVTAGDAVVTVTATDPQGATVSRRMTVTVTPPTSTAPEVAQRIPPQAVLVDRMGVSLDLGPYFRDPDGDPLTYAVVSHDDDVLGAEVAEGGSKLTLRGAAIGQAVVIVTASDPHGGHASQSVIVTVRTNAAPEVAERVPKQAVLAGGASAPLDLAPYFQDPDGDPLTYAAVSDNAAMLVAEVAADGNHLTLRGVAVGEAVIVVVASDPFGEHASQIVTVTVRVNTVLEALQPIPPQTAVAGATNAPLDLGPYFLDPDGDPLAYTAASSDSAVVVAEVAEGDNHLTLRGVTAGEAVVIVTAADPFGEHASQFVTVTVRKNAGPRAAQPMPPQTVAAGGAAPLDLAPYFHDPDGDPLTYTASSSDSAVVVADVAAGGNRLTLRGVTAGEAVVTVMAFDPYAAHVTRTVMVTVQASAAPQALRPIPPQTVAAGASGDPLDLAPYFHDPDGDPLTYTAVPLNAVVPVANAATGGTRASRGGMALSLAPHVHDLNGSPLIYAAVPDAARVLVAGVAAGGNRLTLRGVAAGRAAVVVTARDPHGGHASQTLQVTVQANAAPEAAQPIPPQTVPAGAAGAPLDLAPYFHDPDGDPLAYVAVSDNPAVLVAEVAKGSGHLALRGIAAGRAVVMVTAGDPHGGYVTQALTVTVWTNAPPEVAQPIPPQTLLAGTAGEPLDLAPYFHDPDGDPLTYTAVSDNPAAVVADVAAGSSRLTLRGVAAGDAVVTVTARDPYGEHAGQTLAVAVRTNAAPEVAQPIPPQTVLAGAAADPLDLAPYFHDPDGDPLTYAALSANPEVATAAVTDRLFTLAGVAVGTAAVTVTARDPHDAAASQTVTVTVTVADPAWVKAWIARFGRTVSGQVLDGVQERLRLARQPGFEATLAGHRLDGIAADEAMEGDDRNPGDAAAFRRELGALAGWMDEQMDAPTSAAAPGQALTGRDLLTSTAFTLTGADADSGFAALWGRGAVSRFAGDDGALSLDGEVATGMLGADWVSGRWLAGLTLALSRGTGAYRAAGGSGDVESTLTGLYPWLGYHVTDRLSVWTALGYGAGVLTLTPQDEAAMAADLSLAMVAAGARSDLLELPQLGGILLALETDTRLTRTATDATDATADLDAVDATVWQLRLGLEGSRHVALPGGGALRPSIELGLRHDGGDAETGSGIDVGAGLTFSKPASGLSLDLAARGLLAHRASGFREWGASAALAWDPTPLSDHGLSMSLQQSVGASPSGGMHALLARDTMAAAPEVAGLDGAGRLQARLGYGLPLGGGRFVGTPQLGFGLSGGRHDVTLGWHLSVARHERLGLTVGVEASRRENPDAGNPEHGVMLQLRMGQ